MQAQHPERIIQDLETAREKLQEVEDIFIKNNVFYLLDETRDLIQSVLSTKNFIYFVNSGE